MNKNTLMVLYSSFNEVQLRDIYWRRIIMIGNYQHQIKSYNNKHVYIGNDLLSFVFGKRIIISNFIMSKLFYSYMGIYDISISDDTKEATFYKKDSSFEVLNIDKITFIEDRSTG